jgi:Zn-dependent alcohol dehydrogenase
LECVCSRGAVLWQSGQVGPYAESNPLEVCEVELAPPGPGELLVRMRAAGICHSDLSVIDGSRPRPVPMLLGHEGAGEVVAVGSGVSGFGEGDHVVLSFVPACGSCPVCLAGRPGLCEAALAANSAGTLLGGAGRITGPGGQAIKHHLGVSAFADYAVVSERSAVKVDADLDFEVAALFGCAVMTGVGAVLHSAEVQAGESVAIFGLGGVGMAALLGAVLAGAGQIVVVDPVAAKRQTALELGATEAISPEGAEERIRELVPGGIDKVVETVGNADVLAQAFAVCGRGGTTTTVGLPHPSQSLAIPASLLVAEEKSLRGSYLGSCVPNRDIPRFIDLYRAGRLPVDRLLTDRVELEAINGAMDRLAGGETIRQVILL